MNDLKLIRELVKDLRGEILVSPYTEEELIPSYKDEEGEDANKVFYLQPESEDTKYPVNKAVSSEFNFFQDGQQRTLQIGTIPIITRDKVKRILPISYFTVASVILKRTNKNLSVFDKAFVKSGLILEKSLISSPEILTRLDNSKIAIEDTSSNTPTNTDEPNDYYSLKRKALRRAKTLRLKTEVELLNNWNEQNPGDDFVLIDGTIMNLRSADATRRCIGISKSARINFPDFDKVFKLKDGERSGIFSFHEEDGDTTQGARERFSWFLRLRDSVTLDPEFGLIRVEIDPYHRKNAVDLANRLSSSLLLEKLPTNYPDGNWHKSLYPIKECSSYLSSLLPTNKTIQAQIKL